MTPKLYIKNPLLVFLSSFALLAIKSIKDFCGIPNMGECFFIALKKKKGDHILRTYFLFVFISTQSSIGLLQKCASHAPTRGRRSGEGRWGERVWGGVGGDPGGGKEGITRNAQRT